MNYEYIETFVDKKTHLPSGNFFMVHKSSKQGDKNKNCRPYKVFLFTNKGDWKKTVEIIRLSSGYLFPETLYHFLNGEFEKHLEEVFSHTKTFTKKWPSEDEFYCRDVFQGELPDYVHKRRANASSDNKIFENN